MTVCLIVTGVQTSPVSYECQAIVHQDRCTCQPDATSDQSQRCGKERESERLCSHPLPSPPLGWTMGGRCPRVQFTVYPEHRVFFSGSVPSRAGRCCASAATCPLQENNLQERGTAAEAFESQAGVVGAAAASPWSHSDMRSRHYPREGRHKASK